MAITTLVIDDNQDDRYLARRAIERSDAFGDVIEVPSGVEFCRSFVEGDALRDLPNQPVLVLMDINMPRKSGFEAIEHLQKQIGLNKAPPSVVCMMFTSSENPEDIERARKLSAVFGYVVKPITKGNIDKLAALYQDVVAGQQTSDENLVLISDRSL